MQVKIKEDVCYCPKCGRGGMIQFKSAYLALKNWNKMQKRLRKFDCICVITENE